MNKTHYKKKESSIDVGASSADFHQSTVPSECQYEKNRDNKSSTSHGLDVFQDCISSRLNIIEQFKGLLKLIEVVSHDVSHLDFEYMENCKLVAFKYVSIAMGNSALSRFCIQAAIENLQPVYIL